MHDTTNISQISHFISARQLWIRLYTIFTIILYNTSTIIYIVVYNGTGH